METPDERAQVNRSNEIRSGLQIFSNAIQEASKRYSPDAPNQAREAIGIALVGVIQLISDLHPEEPSLPRPLNELLYGLRDLNRGKVASLFKLTKVSHSPGIALSEDLFRAVVLPE
jgi:hypothetical protein